MIGLIIMQNRINESTLEFILEGDITSKTIGKLRNLIIDSFRKVDKIKLNLAGIEEFDVNGYQMIERIVNEAKKNNKEIIVSQLSAQVQAIYDK